MDLVEVADQAAAMADLDAQARGRADAELKWGDSEYVIAMAVLETRTPLPDDVLAEVRAGIPRWYPPSESTRQLMLDAVSRQEYANAR
ncbi:hypothetical protein [Mycolicibacterium phocaicum]|uniref:Uncharacterized protein n=1 Tax=Mycolicibacterium phocaicum TaxID=319706 RepID=A0A7I7ZRC8_9MYCO|nr:hypothetical protein [Mycolicibacterium phocaicum]TLH73674.1 hypothetical protein C1S79_04625 [Mycolicibacterium phocaicum]BBZ55704.1 hypothetical protein MPHO_26960 [Mycolicibacterium phocaicum]